MLARAKERHLRKKLAQQKNNDEQHRHEAAQHQSAATVLRNNGRVSWHGLPVCKAIMSGPASKYTRSGSLFARSLVAKYFVVQQVPREVWDSVEWKKARSRDITRSMRRNQQEEAVQKRISEEVQDVRDDIVFEDWEQLQQQKGEAKVDTDDCQAVACGVEDVIDSPAAGVNIAGTTLEGVHRSIGTSVGSQTTNSPTRQGYVYALAYYASQEAMEIGAAPRDALRLKNITEILVANDNNLSLIIKSTWGELVIQTKFPRERNYWIAGLRAMCGVKAVYADDPEEHVQWPLSFGAEPPCVIHNRNSQQEMLCGLSELGYGVATERRSRMNTQERVDTLLHRARVVWQ